MNIQYKVGMPRICNLAVVWSGLEKEGGNKKDETGKFIKMDVYAQYCRDIPLNWNDIRNADIIPNWSYMQINADIPKLFEIAFKDS